jgi:nucleotide-binding universal stress UspA family protein
MKVLIGYDGSDCADAAITDLQRAGLAENSQITVVTAVDMWPEVPASLFKMEPAALENASPAVKRAHHLAAAALADARGLAEEGGGKVRQLLPNATVTSIARPEAPATALIGTADELRADLIIVGSHGRNALGKFVLGSVSQAVVTNAHCSVRVARKRNVPAGRGLRLVVGVDGSPNSAAAVQAISMRSWPADTHVLTVVALDLQLAVATPQIEAGDSKKGDDIPDWVREMADNAIGELHHAGLTAEPALRFGDPKHVLAEEARAVDADCIFVGARGRSTFGRLLLGSVSTAITSRAHCSVEVVRAGGQ